MIFGNAWNTLGNLWKLYGKFCKLFGILRENLTRGIDNYVIIVYGMM